jgi:hypothetical protein
LLVGGTTFARHRVAYLIGAVVVFCLPAAGWYLGASMGWAPWPTGSSELGLWFGIAGAAIIAFEMLIWPRKYLRGRRLGRARRWMYWHVWLGLLCVPFSLIHTGFHFGGPLTSAVLLLFVVVIASGVWGLAMQQVVPHRLLHGYPMETIEPEVDDVMGYYRKEADELVGVAAGPGPGDPLRTFHTEEVDPYLEKGRRSRSALRSAARAAGLFADLAARAPTAAPAVRKLEEWCTARRQYDQQARLHFWLHNWQLVHLPLSVALCVALAVHIVTALKYW